MRGPRPDLRPATTRATTHAATRTARPALGSAAKPEGAEPWAR